MNVSPLPFLCVGLIAGAAAAFFLVCDGIVKRRMTDRARELIQEGASDLEIVRCLAAEGYDPELSVRIAERVIRIGQTERVTSLLVNSGSHEAVIKSLIAEGMKPPEAEDLAAEASLLEWCRCWRIVLVPLGILLFTAGVAICGVGLVLGDGTGMKAIVSKELVTGVGAVLISLAIIFLTVGFRKAL